MTKKQGDLIHYWISPGLIQLVQRIASHVRPPKLEYAPEGWKTRLRGKHNKGWDTAEIVIAEERKWNTFVRNCQGIMPLGFSHESTDLGVVRSISFHNIHMTYAYVLALVAHQKTFLSILDWGGGLGHYYLIGKAVLPNVTLDYHCKEVSLMVEAGRRLNPEVHYYVDETCLGRSYDLVMINGSLQYMEEWAAFLERISHSVKSFLFLTRVPVVDDGPGFVSIQRMFGVEMFHEQFEQNAVLKVLENAGLELVREFVVGDRPYIKKAPSQCELRGWLFKKG